jgi:histidine decarboxylase
MAQFSASRVDTEFENLHVPGNFTVNSRALERDVFAYFARLWHAKTPHDATDEASHWGYLLSTGSTEGNLYGLWNARDYLKGKALIRDPRW